MCGTPQQLTTYIQVLTTSIRHDRRSGLIVYRHELDTATLHPKPFRLLVEEHFVLNISEPVHDSAKVCTKRLMSGFVSLTPQIEYTGRVRPAHV